MNPGDVRPYIVLVEDEAMLRLVLTEGLSDDGYTVRDFGSARQAEDYLSQEENRADLLVTDVRMADMSGPELFLAARHWRPNLQVLFITGFTRQETLIQNLIANPASLMHKPFTIEELSTRVAYLLSSAT